MTKSTRTVIVKFAIHMIGDDLSNQYVNQILQDMRYTFTYDDGQNKILFCEIIQPQIGEKLHEI